MLHFLLSLIKIKIPINQSINQHIDLPVSRTSSEISYPYLFLFSRISRTARLYSRTVPYPNNAGYGKNSGFCTGPYDYGKRLLYSSLPCMNVCIVIFSGRFLFGWF